MSQRNSNDKCPCGQRHCHQRCSAKCQPPSDTKPVPDASEPQHQLQSTHAQSTGAARIALTPNSQRHGDRVSQRQSIPYWDDFNGIIYEIPYRKPLTLLKTCSQQADGGRSAEPQNPCAEITGDRMHEEKETSHIVPSLSDISQEYMPNGENTKSSDLASCVDAEETQSKGRLSGSSKEGVHIRELFERT